MLTKPTLAKGQSNAFSMSRADLINALTAIGAPAYYLDFNNWKKVLINYRGADGTQSRSIRFETPSVNPMLGDLIVSPKIQSSLVVFNIEVHDFDNGIHSIDRDVMVANPASFTMTEFDLTFPA